MPPKKPNRIKTGPANETKTIPLSVSETSKKKASKKAKKQNNEKGAWQVFVGFITGERLRFTIGLIILLFTIFCFVGMTSYFFTGAEDQSKMELSLSELNNSRNEIKNAASVAGAYISHKIIHEGFGISSFAIVFFSVVLSFSLLKKRITPLWKAFFHSAFWLIWLSAALGSVDFYFKPQIFFYLGGKHGVVASEWIVSYIGELGLILSLAGSLLVYGIIVTAQTIVFLRNLFSRKGKTSDTDIIEDNIDDDSFSVAIGTEIVPEDWIRDSSQDDSEEEIEDEISSTSDVLFEIEKPHINEENKTLDANSIQNDENDDPSYNLDKLGQYDPTLDLSHYKFPTFDLLKVYGSENGTQIDMKEQTANKERITTTLQHYGIEIKSIKATVGPTITLYEIVPKEGIRVSKIRNLEYDIMLSLAATGIRIIAPIPGKGTIGIEVPNADPQIVSMHSVIASKKFQESKFELPIAFGKTITNEIFMVDLAKMPHLLVAGATGQGKSVGLNAIITSLLYKKHPSVLKFVLIDPKKVEFNIYGDIEKHYLAKLPDGEDAIITDTTKVVETLSSLCHEMDDRYDLLKKAHVRNIKEYNEKFINRQLNPEKGHKFLPYIVVIIDEFGDLIMTAGKEVELPIARIAQLARAVGIHMIIATQRPSVNIITGVIKANFPARVAFKVSSLVDSRTIIDGQGANQLVGRGDMLFTSGNELIRVQCAFVDTPEVENIVHHITVQQGYPTAFYLPEYVGADGESIDVGAIDMSKRDPLFEDAARLIVSTQQGSTSNIQRKFSIGYNRAGRIVDQLEVAGIIGPNEGSKARQVLVMDEYHLEQILKNL